MPRISIKTNILTVFLLLVAFVAFSLLFSQYYFSKKLAIESTQKTFSIIAKDISERLNNEAISIRKIIEIKSKHKDLLEPITFDPFHPSLAGLIQVLEIKDRLRAIFFTHKNGDFYEVLDMRNREAPKGTYWMIITIIDNQEQDVFLDKDLKVIEKKKFPKKYNPHVRPWYEKAVHSDDVVSTTPFQFVDIQEMGITYAKELESKGVVLGIDFTLEQINHILSMQKFDGDSEIFLFDKQGKKFLSSSPIVKIDTKLTQELLQHQMEEIVKYKEGENVYYALAKALRTKDAFLGIKINAETLIKPYRESIYYSFFIAIIMLIVALPLILLSTNSIVKPIKALILENEKITNRDFKDVRPVDTNIIEFEALSLSLCLMSSSIDIYQKSQEELLNAIIKVLAEAIDAKSPYTGGHCKRVPEIAQLLLNEANKDAGVFKDFSLTSEDGLREFEIGAWLHDCGKVTTPEYVVDKSTKLETIYNRIHEIRTRFEVLWRDAEIAYLKNEITEEALHVRQKKLQDDYEFIANSNVGGEFMDASKQEHIRAIGETIWQRNFNDRLGLGEVEKLRYEQRDEEILPIDEKLLDDKTHHIIKRDNFDYEDYKSEGFKEEVPQYLYNYGEVYNLCIAKGTLSTEERYKINEHVIMSIKMLEKIPFPPELTKIPEYAGTHHETLIGTGYPRKLTKEELSVPARIMAIADIFEALTASDRPYKKAKTLSNSIKIMSFMVKDEHIDADLFRLFLKSGIYKIYAKNNLKPEQIDKVDIESYM